MIEMSDAAAEAIQRGYVLHCRGSAWLAGELLAEDIPIDRGDEETDRSLRIPERVTIQVPRLDRGVSWDPTDDIGHPLAAYGQTIRIDLGVDLGRAGIEWLRRGEFLVGSNAVDGETVNVELVGLLQLVDEARFVSPFQPTGTFASTVRDLVEPALTVEIDGALVDRAVPGALNWDEDRLDGLYELLDAWPADAYVRPDGVLYVTTADATLGASSLTDGAGGTVLRYATGSSRDGGVSVVVARGQAADGSQVQGVAYDNLAGSPHRINGPFNPLPVPHFFFSPLLTTSAQCRASAQTILKRLRRTTSRMLTASLVPNPAMQAGDAIAVTSSTLTAAPTVLEHLRLPYTADAGDASARLRLEVS